MSGLDHERLTKHEIAFLGTGLMGRPMAARLLASGYRVRAWNRTSEKALPLAEVGAALSDSPRRCVEGADLVILMLESGPVVEEVLFASGLISAIESGAVLIDMTSSTPEIARSQAARVAGRGVGYLDAPVSGGPYGAEEGTLAIMVGAHEDDFATAQPVLASMGSPTRVGPPGSGQVAKLCSQIILGAALGAVSDALLLASCSGADPARVREALMGGFADSRVLRIHGNRMLQRDFIPGGHTRTHLKDIEAAVALAEQAHLRLPTLALTHELLSDLASHGHGEYDNSAMILEVERRNGGIQLTQAAGRTP